ncbi:unnamed protein product [Paramecium pentaurelia]|uniref:Transmembrane protein n=1 Tax=Paramecium pentaurelia TaxID=43138 RepID=A0A8S1UED0_9CILI|nr:unnamed protein product [Paramecium pentaurelia]
MFSQLILSTLLGLTYSNWTKTPQIKIDNFNQSESAVSINTDNIHHVKYPKAYDLDLYYKNGISKSRNISDYEKINNTQLFQQGCSYLERQIKIEYQILIQLPDDSKYKYTDLVVVGYSAFILTSDNEILVVRNEFNETKLKNVYSKSIDISKHLKVNQFRKPRLLKIRDQIFIISENEAISFDVLDWTNDTLPESRKHQIEEVKSINDIYYDEISNRVFVVAGRQGIIVYNYVNEELKKIYTINLDYNVIKVQTHENYLFILDDKRGIHFVSLKDDNYIIDKFFIPIENPISFVYKNNSFLVITQTNKQIRFGIEILINLQNQEYYYNKFYLQDIELIDVQQIGEYQILIGYDVHKLVKTNIYRDFIDENFYDETDFMIPQIEKIQRIYSSENEYSNSRVEYSLGLTPNYLFVMIIIEKYPEIICSSQNQIEQSYMIIINSTQCNNAEKNPFIVCHEQHFMSLSINEILLDFQSQLIVEVVLILGFIIFIIFLGCGIIMCRRWRFAIENMKSKRRQYVNVQVA